MEKQVTGLKFARQNTEIYPMGVVGLQVNSSLQSSVSLEKTDEDQEVILDDDDDNQDYIQDDYQDDVQDGESDQIDDELHDDVEDADLSDKVNRCESPGLKKI